MTIKHITTAQGRLTEATYRHAGKNKCARFAGFLSKPEVQAELTRLRKEALRNG